MKAQTLAYICNHKDGHVKLFMEEPASPMWESSDLVLRHEAQAEIDALKADNAALHAECDRLTRYIGKVPAKEAEAAYDLIDRYLRNNLDDPEYTTMSAALEACYRTLLCPQNDRLTAMLEPQKVLSAEEVTEEGPYFHRVPDGKWELVKVTAWKGALSTEWGMYLFGDEEDEELYGDFIGPIRMPEV